MSLMRRRWPIGTTNDTMHTPMVPYIFFVRLFGPRFKGTAKMRGRRERFGRRKFDLWLAWWLLKNAAEGASALLLLFASRRDIIVVGSVPWRVV